MEIPVPPVAQHVHALSQAYQAYLAALGAASKLEHQMHSEPLFWEAYFGTRQEFDKTIRALVGPETAKALA